MQVYHLAINGTKKDNLTYYRVREMILSGEVDKTTLAWTQGMEKWQPLGELEEFQKVFNRDESVENSTVPEAPPTATPDSETQPKNNRQRRKESWRRVGARAIDLFLFSSALGPVFLFIPEANLLQLGLGVRMVILIFVTLFCCALEALCLSYFGNTVGKWGFGISLSDQNGNRLSFKLAFQRTLLVWVRGLALMIPLITPVAMLFAHARLLTFGVTSWDRDLRIKVTHKKPSSAGRGVSAVIFLIIAVIVYFQYQEVQRLLEEQENNKKSEEKQDPGDSKESEKREPESPPLEI